MTRKGKNAMPKNNVYRSIVAALAVAASATGLYAANAHRFDVTINYAGESATNVPTLLKLSESLIDDFSYADTANGKDFEIYDDTGALLPYEIDTWDPEGESLLWVKVPVFENGKKLTVIYGRTRKDMTANATNVWSGYAGVWHLNEVAADRKSSNATGAAMFDGVVSSYSATNQTTAKFGKSVKIYTQYGHHTGKGGAEGTITYEYEKGGVFVPDNGNMNLTSDFVVSGWFYHSTTDATASVGSNRFRWDNVFSKRRHCRPNESINSGLADRQSGFGSRIQTNGTSADRISFIGPNYTSNPKTSSYYNAADYGTTTSALGEFRPAGLSLSNGSWYHISFAVSLGVATNTSTSAEYETCLVVRRVDGVASNPGDMGIIRDNDEPLAIGNTTGAYQNGDPDNYGDRAWGGYADEVRLIIGAPSDAYLAAEYAGMAQADLLQCGPAREFNAHKFKVTINYAGESATNVPVRLRLSESLIDGFSYAGTENGTNFEIYDDRGTLLPYEIDTWNPEGESILWVKVPVFENGKKLSVIYGRTLEDMTVNATNVWSGYAGVWHMNEVNSEGKYPNATGAAMFDGVVSSYSATNQTTAKFGQSVKIYTTRGHHTGSGSSTAGNIKYPHERGGVFIPDDGNMNLSSNFVMSGWFYHSTTNAYTACSSYAFRYDFIFTKRGHSQITNAENDYMEAKGIERNTGFGVRISAGADTADAIGFAGANTTTPTSSPYYTGHSSDYLYAYGEFCPKYPSLSLENDQWRHLSFAVSYDSANNTGTMTQRLDGEIGHRTDGSEVIGDVGIIKDNDEPFVIGNSTYAYRNGSPDDYGDRAWGGYADEVRLIIGAPSDAYLRAEYAGMADDDLLMYSPATQLSGVMILFF